MYIFFLTTASLLAMFIVGLVLMQHGKGADTGASFGGGASGTVFGARGSANFLSRCTSTAVALFFVNCLALAWLVRTEAPEASLLENEPAVETQDLAPADQFPGSTIPE